VKDTPLGSRAAAEQKKGVEISNSDEKEEEGGRKYIYLCINKPAEMNSQFE
jgi:hypothetical protein